MICPPVLFLRSGPISGIGKIFARPKKNSGFLIIQNLSSRIFSQANKINAGKDQNASNNFLKVQWLVPNQGSNAHREYKMCINIRARHSRTEFGDRIDIKIISEKSSSDHDE